MHLFRPVRQSCLHVRKLLCISLHVQGSEYILHIQNPEPHDIYANRHLMSQTPLKHNGSHSSSMLSLVSDLKLSLADNIIRSQGIAESLDNTCVPSLWSPQTSLLILLYLDVQTSDRNAESVLPDPRLVPVLHPTIPLNHWCPLLHHQLHIIYVYEYLSTP